MPPIITFLNNQLRNKVLCNLGTMYTWTIASSPKQKFFPHNVQNRCLLSLLPFLPGILYSNYRVKEKFTVSCISPQRFATLGLSSLV